MHLTEWPSFGFQNARPSPIQALRPHIMIAGLAEPDAVARPRIRESGRLTKPPDVLLEALQTRQYQKLVILIRDCQTDLAMSCPSRVAYGADHGVLPKDALSVPSSLQVQQTWHVRVGVHYVHPELHGIDCRS
jgi:hypothetical protein